MFPDSSASVPLDAALLSLCMHEQRVRRPGGDPVTVEHLVRCYPALAADREAILQLIYNEVLLREAQGERPRLEEYQSRFPALSRELTLQFEVHQGLGRMSRDLTCPHGHHWSVTAADAAKDNEGLSCPHCGSLSIVPPPPMGSTTVAEGGKARPKLASPEAAESSPPAIAGYEVLRELGRGGMGVIYLARQTGLNRLVALKMIRSAALAGLHERTRFRAEAEAVARVRHPNIVQIYEIGESDGLSYFSLEYCEGGTLAQKLSGAPQPAQAAAELLATLAAAVHAAHQQGVIHRDLKPANVLLAADGTPKVTDFGLAKHLEGPRGQTQSGAVMGTPSYMAPEQARGMASKVGPAVDVYALGTILYEILTGRAPFTSETILDTLAQVVSQEPIAPSRLVPRVPRDLETICLKCLEKEPHRRYASAQALADELGRFLRREPIRARPAGSLERVLKAARRHPTVALLSTMLVVVALVGLGLVLWQWGETIEQRDLADQRREEAVEGRQEEKRAREQAEWDRYISQVTAAAGAWRGGNVGEMETLLLACDQKHRSWEWYYLRRLSRQELVRISAEKAFSYCLAVSPDGRHVAACDQVVKIWETATGREVVQTSALPFDYIVYDITFSPDAKQVIAFCRLKDQPNQEVLIWDAVTGREVVRRARTRDVGMALLWPGGASLLVGLEEGNAPGRIVLEDARSGNVLFSTEAHKGRVYGFAVAAHNADSFFTVGEDGTAKQWALKSGQARTVVSGLSTPINGFAVSQDGALLAISNPDGLRLVEVRDGKERFRVPGGRSGISYPRFTADGKGLLLVHGQLIVKHWDTKTGREHWALRGHADPIFQPTFTQEGRIVTGSRDGTLKIWDPNAAQECRTLKQAEGTGSIALSADGRWLAVGRDGGDHRIAVLELPTFRERAVCLGHTGGVRNLAFHPDGSQLASASSDGTVRLWDPGMGRQVALLLKHPASIYEIRYHDNGRQLVTASQDGEVKLFDVGSGKEVRTLYQLEAKGPGLTGLALHPDGKRLAVSRRDGEIHIVEMENSQRLHVLHGHKHSVSALAFSPDGKSLVSAEMTPEGPTQGTARVWDPNTGHLRHHFPCLRAQHRLAITPDSRRILMAGMGDSRLQVWDLETGRFVVTLPATCDDASEVAVSSDGKWLVTSTNWMGLENINQVLLWDARPLAEP